MKENHRDFWVKKKQSRTSRSTGSKQTSADGEQQKRKKGNWGIRCCELSGGSHTGCREAAGVLVGDRRGEDEERRGRRFGGGGEVWWRCGDGRRLAVVECSSNKKEKK
jgi:hypothetical protein